MVKDVFTIGVQVIKTMLPSGFVWERWRIAKDEMVNIGKGLEQSLNIGKEGEYQKTKMVNFGKVVQY